MTLHAFTARLGTRDPDVLDITRKSGVGDALAFAPSWEIVRPVIDLRQKLAGLRDGALNADRQGLHATARDLRRLAAEVEGEIDRAWDLYVGRYTEEMRRSYVERRYAWDALLARPRIVLACFCQDHTRCHRTLLARDILPRLGAVYGGELGKAEAAQKGLFT